MFPGNCFELGRIDLARSPIAFVLLALTLVGFASLFIRKHRFHESPRDSRNSIVFALLIGVFFILLLVQAGGVSGPARFVPVIVLSTSLGLLALRIYFHFFRVAAPPAEEKFQFMPGLPAVLGIFLFGPLVVLVGPVLAAALFMLAWLVIKTEIGVPRAVLVSASTAIIALAFTRYGLQRSFDGGMVERLIETGRWVF